ncbi:MAG TPA: flagellar biosynthetic protein FliO [Xanthomonadaceae bacterium]|nr:flagellar biosynthetic protein FliO [Xanthomonadaceae bacterium]
MTRIIAAVLLSAVFAAATAAAVPVAPAATQALQVGQALPQSPGVGGALMALALVVALILFLAFVLKKLPGAGLKALPGLRVVASLAVGPRERVVVVDCAGQQLLLGVTPHSVNLLHTLPEPLLDAPTQAGFAELLARLKSNNTA